MVASNSTEARMDPDKKWVWVEDNVEGYIAGFIFEEDGDKIKVNLTTDEIRWVNINDTQKVNPPKFDRLEDMAELSYLNEASVAHNLKTRYHSNLIYTYSGLFLVSVNPYYKLPIYTEKVVKAYKNKRRTEMPPHIYAIADSAFHYMLQNRENQSILITGESGAGKTENTKKVIQYLTSVAADRSLGKITGALEKQILRANPILEAFGNAQTIRNNNSSRFGKFIRIEFSSGGQIAGANIEKYLFEKSRVTQQSPHERNYHIFYQFMKGAPKEVKDQLLITDDLNDYGYIKNSVKNIDGVDDVTDFKITKDSMDIMNFTPDKQILLFRVLAAVLHLGNIRPVADRDDQAQLRDTSAVEKLCHVLSIPVAEFTKGLLRPQMKAGRDWVTQARNVEQVLYSLEALARAIYDRMFGLLVEWINAAMDRPSEKSTFIGVLDIAGFEIFEFNSFEQLCINYNNEKLQQFFNHHMFKREQEEYLREGINWKFIDFGLDLQPTIDLIEKSNPIGIFSCLDEECVMPKATDKTFTEKLITLWKDKSDKFETLKFNQGFILKHYASNVEYRTDNWLDKNKDPLNENITRLLANSSEKYIAYLFEDYSKESSLFTTRNRAKKGLFRTVAQRHKEQLSLLMSQLNATEPHFVRCILPNQDKKPGKINTPLVLDQLRCNGVLEGIRICRAGFPNRLPFSEFRQRYEILAPGAISKGFMDGKNATQKILEAIQLDNSRYRIGSSKVFFRSGVLAELEEARDANLSNTISQIQATCRGFLARKLYRKRLDQLKAIKIIQKNARVYVQLREWSWWKLYTKVKPLLNVTRVDEELKKKEDSIKSLENVINAEKNNRIEVERLKNDLENEKKKLEELLIAERNAALDNEEILRRTQKREMALEEELKDLASEFENIENQFEELNNLKAELENQLQNNHNQLNQEKSLINNLEKDIQSKVEEFNLKNEEFNLVNNKLVKLEDDKKELDQLVIDLQEQLSLNKHQENELLKTKAKLEQQINELNNKLAKETQDKIKIEENKNNLETQLNQAINELEMAEKQINSLQNELDNQIVEFSNLGTKLKSEETSKISYEKEKRELLNKIQSYESELKLELDEKDQLINNKNKLEQEIQELHNLIEKKGDEESKLNEHRKLKENELNQLKESLNQTKQELQELKKNNNLLLDQFKQENDKLNYENELNLKSKQVLESKNQELLVKLETLEANISSLEKSKRLIENQLKASNDHIVDLQNNLDSVKNNKEELDKSLFELNNKYEESESNIGLIQREKQSLERQINLLNEQLNKEKENSFNNDSLKKKHLIEIKDLQCRLEELEVSKTELRNKLDQKDLELEEFKEHFNVDNNNKLNAIEEQKRKVELELIELTSNHEELQRQFNSLEKSKLRLISEIEDLKHEVEVEHNNTRNAEKLVKQFESQIDTINLQNDQIKQDKDNLEANYRKLSSNFNSLEKQLQDKQEQLDFITNSKSDMELQLRALIDEIGDGGKNLIELEKSKRKLEAELESRNSEVEELKSKLIKVEDNKKLIEQEYIEFKTNYHSEMDNKDFKLEETKRLLLKEVNQLGERLEQEISNKNEMIKNNKKLEDQIEDLKTNFDYSNQSKSDLENAKKKADDFIKVLQANLEAEEKLRINFEELAQRHEHKSNQLLSKLESLELQYDALDKFKKQLEDKIEVLNHELNEGESKTNLLDTIRKIEKEKQLLGEQLIEEKELRQSIEKNRDVNSFSNIGNNNDSELKEQLEKLEESRRALLITHRINQQDLEAKQKELENVIKSKDSLQNEINNIKVKLENEIELKNKEINNSRKYKRAYNELLIKLENENLKNSEFKESINNYKSKIEELLNSVDNNEIEKLNLQKEISNLNNHVEELSKEILDLNNQLNINEQQIQYLNEQLNDNTMQFNNVSTNDDKLELTQELKRLREEAEKDFEERSKELDEIRSKYQFRITELSNELELSQNNLLNSQLEIQSLNNKFIENNNKLDENQFTLDNWQKEKAKLDSKVKDLNEANLDNLNSINQLTEDLDKVKYQLKIAQDELEVKESEVISLNKSKKFLQEQLNELENKFNNVELNRTKFNDTINLKGQETNELKELLDNQNHKIDILNNKLNKYEITINQNQLQIDNLNQVNAELLNRKALLEKQNSELNNKLIDLESLNFNNNSINNSKLSNKIDGLVLQLNNEIQNKNELVTNYRKNEKLIRELKFQLNDKDNQFNNQSIMNNKNSKFILQLKNKIDEMENNESNLMLSKRRSERELLEEKEKNMRLEKEIERLKTRLEKTISTSVSPYNSIRSPMTSINSLKSPLLNMESLRSPNLNSLKASDISMLGSINSSSTKRKSVKGPSIANSNFRELLFKFNDGENKDKE